jgi:sugar-specific transcriptional regulator TrmB
MELDKVLELLGLNEKEAKVYLALLQLGTASVPKISVRAGTKRPTTYLILEDLRKRSLVTPIPRGITTLYTAESPERLLEEERIKKQAIENNLPELMAIFNSKKEKPKVRFYQGERYLEELYNEVFRQKTVDLYGSIGVIDEKLPGIIEKNAVMMEKHKPQVRELLQADKKSIEYAKKMPASENHQIKVAPENYQFPTDNIIFGNKLAILSYKDEPMAVIIESSDVVATYKSMFEIVWNSI